MTKDRYQTLCKALIPTLSHNLHKGQAGRVAIIGGSKYYTGAPYYAAISSLKAGGDLSFVICTPEAAIPIKSYSPELMVAPILSSSEHRGQLSEFESLVKRSNTFVIGPGLGRDEETLKDCESFIQTIQKENLPMVIDGDGLFLLTQKPKLIHGYQRAILTPNVVELAKLFEAVFGSDYKEQKKHLSTEELLKELSSELGNVTIVQKGKEDIIVNALMKESLKCSLEDASPRRSGGQGDSLAGLIGLFTHWALESWNRGNIPAWSKEELKSQDEKEISNIMLGIYASCVLLKESGKASFRLHKRGSTTPNIIDEIPSTFDHLFADSTNDDRI